MQTCKIPPTLDCISITPHGNGSLLSATLTVESFVWLTYIGDMLSDTSSKSTELFHLAPHSMLDNVQMDSPDTTSATDKWFDSS